MTDNKELKRCPFCGGEAQDDCSPSYSQKLRYVLCKKCEAQGPLSDTNDEAIAAWNRRAICAEQK